MRKLFEIRRYYYYKVERVPEFIFLNKEVQIKVVSWENYKDICECIPNLEPVFRSFLECGNVGIYGYLEGHLVAYAWSILNKGKTLKKVRGFFPLPGDAACVHYCRVLESYRGRKIYQTMLACLYRILYKEVCDIYLDTEVTNIPAQKAIEKSHGKVQGELVRVMFFGKTLFIFKRREK